MVNIAIIGAGSIGFTRGIVRDILSIPELRDNVSFRFTNPACIAEVRIF